MKKLLPLLRECSLICLVVFALKDNSLAQLTSHGAESASTPQISPQAVKAPSPPDIISFSDPLTETLQGDLGRVNVINPMAGRLAHAFAVLSQKLEDTTNAASANSYFALHGLKVGTRQYSTLTYTVNKPYIEDVDNDETRIIYDPQFSPNGRYILLKFGQPWYNGLYRLYVLDTKDNTLHLASNKYLRYKLVSWSPDNNYLTFVEGGDREGSLFLGPNFVGPLNLYVCNWRTREIRPVVSRDVLRAPFSWLSPHTLLYSALSAEEEKEWEQSDSQPGKGQSPKNTQERNEVIGAKNSKPNPRPNIYAYSYENNKSTLLFRDGFLPVPSPDGKRLAFFGSEDPAKLLPLRYDWASNPQGAVLSVAQLDGSARIALNQEGGSYPFIRWLPDNQHLLTLAQTGESPNARALIKLWDIKTRHFKEVATLQATDYKEAHRSLVEPQFLPLQLNSKGDALFVLVNEFTGLNHNTRRFIIRDSLKEVNLDTGKVITVLQTKDDFGIDWLSSPMIMEQPK